MTKVPGGSVDDGVGGGARAAGRALPRGLLLALGVGAGALVAHLGGDGATPELAGARAEVALVWAALTAAAAGALAAARRGSLARAAGARAAGARAAGARAAGARAAGARAVGARAVGAWAVGAWAAGARAVGAWGPLLATLAALGATFAPVGGLAAAAVLLGLALAGGGLAGLGAALARRRAASARPQPGPAAAEGAAPRGLAVATALLLGAAALHGLPTRGGLGLAPWPPPLAARALDASPATLVLEAAGFDWLRRPAVYGPAGADAIGPDLRSPWHPALAGAGALVLGCALSGLALAASRRPRT